MFRHYIISDGCDEDGLGQFQIRVQEFQLKLLLDHDLIYEDTVSEYVKPSGRRHFHPMHERTDMAELTEIVMNWPGFGSVSRAQMLYQANHDLTVNVPSNEYLK